MIETSSSLLQRVKDHQDSEAWARFDALYRPLLATWARAAGVQSADVDDVVQRTLWGVARRMPDFVYQRERGGFRRYLHTAFHNHLKSYFRTTRKKGQHVVLLVEGAVGVDDPSEKMFEEEYHRHLLRRCLEEVRPEVDEATWAIFVRYWVEKVPAKELARELDLTPATITSRCWRVLQMVRERARAIDPDLWPEM